MAQSAQESPDPNVVAASFRAAIRPTLVTMAKGGKYYAGHENFAKRVKVSTFEDFGSFAEVAAGDIDLEVRPRLQTALDKAFSSTFAVPFGPDGVLTDVSIEKFQSSVDVPFGASIYSFKEQRERVRGDKSTRKTYLAPMVPMGDTFMDIPTEGKVEETVGKRPSRVVKDMVAVHTVLSNDQRSAVIFSDDKVLDRTASLAKLDSHSMKTRPGFVIPHSGAKEFKMEKGSHSGRFLTVLGEHMATAAETKTFKRCIVDGGGAHFAVGPIGSKAAIAAFHEVNNAVTRHRVKSAKVTFKANAKGGIAGYCADAIRGDPSLGSKRVTIGFTLCVTAAPTGTALSDMFAAGKLDGGKADGEMMF